MKIEKKIKYITLPYVRHVVNNEIDYSMKVGTTNKDYLFIKGTPQLVHSLDDFKWFSNQPEYEAFLATGPMTNYFYNDNKESLNKTLEWAKANSIQSGNL